MDIQETWEKALKYTDIIRSRVSPLLTFQDTELPYIFLAESSVNTGDTVVREGKILVERPSIILPSNLPQFEGFEFDKDYRLSQDMIITFLLVRGVSFPSLKYNNQVSSLNVYEGGLKKAIEHFSDRLQKAEDVHSGLIAGPEDCWQFSLLIFVCGIIARSADGDIKKLLDELRRKGRL